MSDLWAVPGYTNLRVLRRGTTGTLVLARAQSSGDEVAIRYLGPALRGDEAFRGAFRAEVRVLREIDASHLVRVVDYVEEPHGAALVTQFVLGGSLLTSLATRGPTGPESALAVLKNSLLGLDLVHRLGLVHGDVRPRAILITLTGQCRLTDLGVSPRSTGRVGTFAYRPPTHLAGGVAGPAGDIYAATATFVECLTGRTPAAGHDRIDLLPEPVRELARRGLSVSVAVPASQAAALLERLDGAAARAYGRDWESAGRWDLASRAAALAARPERIGDRWSAVPDRPASSSSPRSCRRRCGVGGRTRGGHFAGWPGGRGSGPPDGEAAGGRPDGAISGSAGVALSAGASVP